MDLSEASGVLERVFDSGGGWSSEQRLMHLAGDGAASGLLVESCLGFEAVSGPYVWRLLCLSADAHLDPETMLMQSVSLHIRLADGSFARRSALVLEAESLCSIGGAARYRLTAGPWLSLLAYNTHSRLWQDKTTIQILEDVFAHYAAHAAWRCSDEIQADLESSPSRGVHDLRVQYRETDLAFVQRLLAREGWSYRFEESADAPAGHQLIIFADSAAQPEDATSQADGGIRFHRSSSQESSDAIQALGGSRAFDVGQTSYLKWDADAQRAAVASMSSAPHGCSDQAPRIERYEVLGACSGLSLDLSDTDTAQAALDRQARIQTQAQDARLKTWLARSTVRTMRAGTRFDLKQSMLDELAWVDQARSAQTGGNGFFVTQVRHLGINNLPRELRASMSSRLGMWFKRGAASTSGPDATLHALEELFEPSGCSSVPGLADALDFGAQREDLVAQAEQSGYGNAFQALRTHVPWRPDPAQPRMALGMQTATVVDAQADSEASGQAVHTDQLGRVRVRFHWQVGPEADARDDNRLSCWVRVAQCWAGPGASSQFVPRVGMEVLVTFLDGDIEQPVVTGCVYNGRGEAGVPATPGGVAADANTSSFAQATDHCPSAQGNAQGGNSPVWHGAAAASDQHGHAAALSGLRTQELDGGEGGHNQLLFDDSPDQLAVQAGSTRHATWLNLGHLIHRADNHRDSYRGEGFELRTDAHGSVRGSLGVLLTTHALNPHQPAGHNDAAVALARQAQTLADACQRAAFQHQTVALAAAMSRTGSHRSELNDREPPLSAIHASLDAQVDARPTDPASSLIPHSADALISLSAQASLMQTAAQDFIVSAGDVVHVGSGESTHLASGGALRIHAGQALGMLGGAIEPGHGAAGAGLTLIAAQGDVHLQAQSGAMHLAAQRDVAIRSANGGVQFAAAQELVLSTAGGARITLAGGTLSVQCPGKLTVRAANKAMLGGESVETPLTSMPNEVCVACLLRARAAGAPFSLR